MITLFLKFVVKINFQICISIEKQKFFKKKASILDANLEKKPIL